MTSLEHSTVLLNKQNKTNGESFGIDSELEWEQT